MAKRLKDLQGWEILVTDQNGEIIEEDKRGRSRRGNNVERIVLKRTSDGITLTRGDSVKVRNDRPCKRNPDDFFYRFIQDIKLNTTNNVVEVWVFDYVNWTNVEPVEYYIDINPKVIELKESNEFYAMMFKDETDKDELYLSLEPSEIFLANFLSKINVVSEKALVKDAEVDKVCKIVCDANCTKYGAFNYEREIDAIKDLSFKEVEEHFKNILFPPEEEEDNEKPVRKSPVKKVRGRPKKLDTILKIDLPSDPPSESDSSDEEIDGSSSSDEFQSADDGEMASGNEENVETDSDEDLVDTSSGEEEIIDDLDDEDFVKQPRKRGRPRSATPKIRKLPKVRKTLKEKKGKKPKKVYYIAPTIKKFTKLNVVRAKKKYTPFSKKYNSIKEIPNLTKTPGFYQQSKEDVFNQLETKLETKKQHEVVETIFSKVKKQLYSSHGKEMIVQSKDFDDIIPGRENEFASIYLSIYSAIEASSATTVYIAGTPGVGKTLTVREVMKEISKSAINDELPPFSYVEINGLKMVKPTDSYEVLWNSISGERLTWGAAMESLEFYFNKVPQGKKKTMVVLLDELDALVTKGQDIMYNFFNWTTYENAKLIVIAVANTMDLPERQLGNKVSSRIGFTRIMFSGYNHDELKAIIDFRLKGLNNSYFYVDTKTGSAHLMEINEEDGETSSVVPPGMRRVQLRMSQDAIEIASRKVASVSGDARRALKVCKRAAEIAEQYYMNKHGYGYDGGAVEEEEGGDGIEDEEDKKNSETDSDEIQTVHINHVMKALNETINSHSVKFITGLSFTCKLFLFALLNLSKKTGLQEQSLGDIIDEIKNLIEVNGNNKFIMNLQDMIFAKGIPNNYEQLRMISWEYLLNELIESGIVIKQTMRNERLSCVRLNISNEDVKHALYQDETLKSL
ncbi:origin recognition complex subunit 1 [Monosporozyma unispora]|nr:Origin recognition complex, subunit 1 [Kazachstania unispora]